MFKNSPDTTLIATRKAQGGLVDEYTISKSSKGISMSYRQTGKNGKSFGGGATTVSGYWDVAQRMNSMEKSGMKFKPATTSKNARYDTSKAINKKAKDETFKKAYSNWQKNEAASNAKDAKFYSSRLPELKKELTAAKKSGDDKRVTFLQASISRYESELKRLKKK